MIDVRCRTCDRDMDRVKRGSAYFWYCQGCGAHALSESALRKIVPPLVWAAIWPAIREAAVAGARGCPACERPMEETREVDDAGSVRVDYCETCRIVWLDSGELAQMPKVPVVESPALSPAAAKLLAQAYASEYDAREGMVFGLAGVAVHVLVALVAGFGSRR